MYVLYVYDGLQQRRGGARGQNLGPAPSLDLDGDFEVKVRVDKRLLRALNAEGAFRGHLINEETVGKSGNDLVED